MIDHFICSRDIVECNDCVIIHNDDDNLSDRLAIEYSLHIEALCPYVGNSSECLLSRNTSPKLLWDRVAWFVYLVNANSMKAAADYRSNKLPLPWSFPTNSCD